MLEILGKPYRLCDGSSRRSFLRAGFLGFAGLSLSGLLRREASASSSPLRSKRSVILIWQHGGPSQLETFDMKP